MKSEVFNGSRFWNYFKYDFRQMWRNHVKASIGIGLSGLILYVVWVVICLATTGHWQAPGIAARLTVFILAFTALEFYQTRTYGYLTDRRKGSAWLLLPASSFEKWLSMMLMTLIIIPAFFLVASLGIDALLCLVDPTCGAPLVTSFADGFSTLSGGFVEINQTYETSWNPSVFLAPVIAGFCANFLFFLLCGISFKRYKILWGFALIFLASISILLVSVVLLNTGVLTDTSIVIEESDPALAEAKIRTLFSWETLITSLFSALLAFLAYRRIKTLKH